MIRYLSYQTFSRFFGVFFFCFVLLSHSCFVLFFIIIFVIYFFRWRCWKCFSDQGVGRSLRRRHSWSWRTRTCIRTRSCPTLSYGSATLSSRSWRASCTADSCHCWCVIIVLLLRFCVCVYFHFIIFTYLFTYLFSFIFFLRKV